MKELIIVVMTMFFATAFYFFADKAVCALETKYKNVKKENNIMKNQIVMERMSQLNQLSVISIDAETNGLWGQPFALAAVVYDVLGNETARFVGRCPIVGDVDSWVAENVLPKMDGIPETHASYEELLSEFIHFISPLYKVEGHRVLCHMGHIVEAKLFRDAYELGLIGAWDAPYEWLDVCLFFGDSVDSYNREHGIELSECEGGSHNPVYDCISAYRAFKHFIG